MSNYHAAVFIGRFSPFHRGHVYVVEKALQQAQEVIIVVGSSFAAPNTRTPFTFEQRRDMIRLIYPDTKRVKIVPVSDYPYDDNKWVAAVQSVVSGAVSYTPDPIKIALIGHKKDHTSYYLDLFKTWDSIAVDNLEGISATPIREAIFSAYLKCVPELVPDKIWDYIQNIILTKQFSDLRFEWRKIRDYHETWKSAPYTPHFVTTDAILTQSGHVLLIERGDFPGKGLWALPGGFLEPNLTVTQNMIKELKEETRVKVPEKVLLGSIKRQEVFDAPRRDPRGRFVTHGFYIDLGFPKEDLPKVKGGSDARHAEWIQLGDLQQDMFAFDHWHIVNRMLNLG
ncbi:MAG: bifunctional nicotinamide-nucleotide adenylyltransferase/Nudix hydroxylase [Anaerolineaceae bacterium]